MVHPASYSFRCLPSGSTSHSSTTLRTNILFTFKVHTSTGTPPVTSTSFGLSDMLSGYGEVGLPPKKPLCYLADYRDVKTYFEGYVKTVRAISSVFNCSATAVSVPSTLRGSGCVRGRQDLHVCAVRMGARALLPRPSPSEARGYDLEFTASEERLQHTVWTSMRAEDGELVARRQVAGDG